MTPLVGGEPPATVRSFVKAHCLDCHANGAAEGGLDLDKLGMKIDDPNVFKKWVRIVDRVHDGEMPPAEAAKLSAKESNQFVAEVAKWLHSTQKAEQDSQGRVRGRRLTNLQVERTLHDLLGIDIPLANQLPDETRVEGFGGVAEGQSMSHFQLARHLAAVDLALDEAFRRALGPPDEKTVQLSAKEICRIKPEARTREPEFIDEHAVTWSSGLEFYGRLPATTAKDSSGWYRFTIRAKALKAPKEHGVWCTVRNGRCVSSAPLLPWVGSFEATDELRDWTFETWMPQGNMLEVRPGDVTLKKARFQGGQVGPNEGGPQDVPGIAIHSITMERFHRGPDNAAIRKLLFDNLEVVPPKPEKGKDAKTRREQRAAVLGQLATKEPEKDAERLMLAFATRAFRRPTTIADIEPYVAMVRQSITAGAPFSDAIRGGYRAILCSQRFLFFPETPGKLDDYALANRVSYFLWNSMPDAELMQVAAAGKLRDRKTLDAQVERMLAGPRAGQFVKDFAADWLDLRLIDFTDPDRRLYPEFDVIVQNAMLDETHTFLAAMLRDNLSIGRLIDSDFTFLNNRLARHYQIPGVTGDVLQKVALRPTDHRGGLLTQGAVLKVTANGTTTSPVTRGVWIAERLLGVHVPPPPENVPAVEPDIRGTNTIRDMLAKHRSDNACASCHTKIDPAGFALENYDPAGRWRDSYPKVGGGKRIKVDPSYSLADGRQFKDVAGFRSLILDDKEQLARNVAEKLLVFGTGATITFADRPAVERIVRETVESDYGMRSLVHAVVASSIFGSK